MDKTRCPVFLHEGAFKGVSGFQVDSLAIQFGQLIAPGVEGKFTGALEAVVREYAIFQVYVLF